MIGRYALAIALHCLEWLVLGRATEKTLTVAITISIAALTASLALVSRDEVLYERVPKALIASAIGWAVTFYGQIALDDRFLDAAVWSYGMGAVAYPVVVLIPSLVAYVLIRGVAGLLTRR